MLKTGVAPRLKVVVVLTALPDSVPENVLLPAMVWAVVRSTKFCVAEPVPPFATGTTPSLALLSVPDEIFEALRFVRPEPLPVVNKYWFAAMPPSCVEFVAVAAFVALVALIAFVALSADELLIAYGELVTRLPGRQGRIPAAARRLNANVEIAVGPGKRWKDSRKIELYRKQAIGNRHICPGYNVGRSATRRRPRHRAETQNHSCRLPIPRHPSGCPGM